MGSLSNFANDYAEAVFGLNGVEFNQSLADIGGFALANLLLEFQIFNAPGPVKPDLQDFRPSDGLLTVGQGGVVIEAVADDGDGAALLAQLEALGLMFGGAYKNAVSGLFPIDALDQLPEVANLAFAGASYVMPRLGSVTSQADVGLNADDVRADFGVDGSGITVGVLSDSFDTAVSAGNQTIDYADDIASGDLPAGITILQEYFGSDAIDEGRAMAQLIYDLAPGVDMEFASAFLGPAAFAQSIQDLAVNSDVIVDDIGYLAEPFFQDGVIAQAVDTVFAQGKAYFSAAGNSADNSYEQAFRPVDANVLGGGIATWHDFDPGPGIDLEQNITLAPGDSTTLSFQWDEPFITGAPGSPGSASNLDIGLIDSVTKAIVAVGIDANIGGDPRELFNYTNTTGVTQNLSVVIELNSGPAPNVIKYIDFGTGVTGGAEYATGSGTSFGHPSAEGGLGVGAAFYAQTPEFGVSPPRLEDFSSKGDTPIYFDANGNRLLTPEIRERIDITAIDGTDTTFFGGPGDATPAPNFFGTSAAAPHAAALAALMLEADGTLTPTEIYDAMRDSAIDITSTQGGIFTGVGYDNWSGHGLIDGPGAFAEAGIGISALPDLIATNLTSPNTVLAGQDLAFNFDIENIGSADAGGFDAGVYISTDPIVDNFDNIVGFTSFAAGLTDGSTAAGVVNGTIPSFLTPGIYYIAAFADDFLNQVIEEDETNNASSVIQLEVLAPPVRLFNENGTQLNVFSTVADAFNAANAGDQIVVDGSVYAGGTENATAGADDLSLTLPSGVRTNVALDTGVVTFTLLGDGFAEIDGNADGNRISGSSGNDTIFGQAGDDTIKGLDGADFLFGDDVFLGPTGDDFISGRGGADTIGAGPGNDTAYGGTENDFVGGGPGNDSLFGGTGEDTLEGNEGNDTLVGQDNNDTLIGGIGEDNLVGGGGNDSMVGGNDNDTLAGQAGNDTIEGGEGSDQITGKFGDDSIDGGGGADNIFAGAENDTVNGGLGNDTIRGEGQNDLLNGDGGNDTITGGGSRDTINGGDDDDRLFGQGGLDIVRGDDGNDEVFGGTGNDLLFGGADNDTLYGQTDNDRIDGGTGSDELNGNGGVDTFVFMSGYDDDEIIDFDTSSEVIELDFDLLTANGIFSLLALLDPTNGVASQTTPTTVTFDFGGGDILIVGGPSGVTLADLGGNILIVV